MLILSLSALGTAPCWGVHLQKKKWMKWRGFGDEQNWREGHSLIPSLVKAPRFIALLQISPSAESPWCHDIVYRTPLPVLGSPSSPFPEEHSSAALRVSHRSIQVCQAVQRTCHTQLELTWAQWWGMPHTTYLFPSLYFLKQILVALPLIYHQPLSCSYAKIKGN